MRGFEKFEGNEVCVDKGRCMTSDKSWKAKQKPKKTNKQ